jgi:forkhead transcription factor HCM1
MQLLPPASLSSPVKNQRTHRSHKNQSSTSGAASHLKTPPNSTLRVTNAVRTTPTSSSTCTSTSTLQSPGQSLSMSLSVNDHSKDYSNNNSNSSDNSKRSHSQKHGLLSPEFSSPNLYDHTLAHETSQGSIVETDDDNDNSNDDFKGRTNITISVLPKSPIKSTRGLPPPLPIPVHKDSRKRTAESFTSTSTSNSSKRAKLSPPEDFVLPEPEDMPPVPRVEGKPSLSYATLIGMAILRATDRRLTLAEIYAWITNHFPYYKKGDVGWQNSIRHNLSLNKAFEKTEKSKDKKGHFWKIVPGWEHLYCNIKDTKKGNSTVSSAPSSSSSSSSSSSAKQVEPSTPKTSTKDQLASSPNTPTSLNASFLHHSNLHSNNNSNNTRLHRPLSSHSRNPSDSLSVALGLGTIPELHPYTPQQLTLPLPIPSHHMINDSPSQSSLSLDYTSSFSCRSNFELSPLRPSEPGPIFPLEPITPNRTNVPQRLQLPPISKHLQSLNPTPLSLKLAGSTANGSHNYSAFSRRLWASPSYLDDFYTSPIAPQYQSQTLYGSPLPKRKLHQSSSVASTATTTLSLSSRLQSTLLANVNATANANANRDVENATSKQMTGSSSSTSGKHQIRISPASKDSLSGVTNGYSTNEIFGIDVCTLHDDSD